MLSNIEDIIKRTILNGTTEWGNIFPDQQLLTLPVRHIAFIGDLYVSLLIIPECMCMMYKNIPNITSNAYLLTWCMFFVKFVHKQKCRIKLLWFQGEFDRNS